MVNEPLLGRSQLAVHHEPAAGHVVLVGMPAGPAGVAELRLRDGVSVSIDVAIPQQLCDVTVEEVAGGVLSPGAETMLQRLVGDERVAELRNALEQQDPKPKLLKGEPSTGMGPSRQNQNASVMTEVASLALGMEQAQSPAVLPHEWALLTLQSAVTANQVGLLHDVVALASDVEDAALLLADPDEQSAVLASAAASAQWANLCTAAAKLVQNELSASELMLLGRRLTEHADHELAQAPVADSPRLPRRKAATSIQAIEAADSLNRLVGAPALELLEQSGDELMARLRTWGARAEGWWLRAFVGDEAEPLAVAPFMVDPFGDAVARFLLARRHRALLHIDVVEDPSNVRVPLEVQALRRAIAVGQRAARLERIDRPTSATFLWSQCSDWHRRARDQRRAGEAEDIAHHSAMGSRLGNAGELTPLVTDEVFAAAADDTVTP